MDDIKLSMLGDREAAETERLKAENKALRNRLNMVALVLSDPLIIMGEHGLRPVKRTSRQDVYKACLKAQMALGLQYRWFPEWNTRAPSEEEMELLEEKEAQL